jgi:ribosomal protein S27AE
MLQQLRGQSSPSLQKPTGVVRCSDCGQSFPALEDADAILRANARFVCGACHYQAWERRDSLRSREQHESVLAQAS